MTKWRMNPMNEQEIIQHMIEFVDQKERQFQSNKFITEQQAKNDVVKSIQDELERVTQDEDK